MKRIMLALIGWIILGIVVIFTNEFVFAALVITATAITLFEFNRIMGSSTATKMGSSIVSGMLVCGIFLSNRPEIILGVLLLTSILTWCVYLICLDESLEQRFKSIITLGFSIVYVPAPMGCMILLRLEPFGTATVGMVLAATWARDAGAFIVGNLMSGKVLASDINPSKTMTGALGGTLAVSILLVAFSIADLLLLSLWDILVLTLIHWLSGTII